MTIADGKNQKVLLMFSGGRDSFLSACRLLSSNYTLALLTFDNGCMLGLNNILEMGKQLVNRYGQNQVKILNPVHIASGVMYMRESWEDVPIASIAKEYPMLRANQMRCLFCQVTMLAAAAAIASVNGIQFLATGYRKSQGFACETDELLGCIENAMMEHGLKVRLLKPVYDLVDDWERKQEIGLYGFVPKAREAQCWLGHPAKPIEQKELNDLVRYWEDHMKDSFEKLIDIFRNRFSDGMNFYPGLTPIED